MITDREKILAIVDNDCLTPSDAVILLEGDGFFRFSKAVDLYKRGMAKKIVFSGNIIDRDYGSFPFEEVKPFILEGGVPEGDLIHEGVSQHTRQQAVEVVKMAMANGWKKLALVASHEHQYRAYLTFLREVLDTKSGIILYMHLYVTLTGLLILDGEFALNVSRQNLSVLSVIQLLGTSRMQMK